MAKFKRFGDVAPGDSIFYLNPVNGKIDFCYVLGNNPVYTDLRKCQMVLLLVPEEARNLPIAKLPVQILRQIRFDVDKGDSFVLVNTVPPTLYCTNQEEITQWKISKSS